MATVDAPQNNVSETQENDFYEIALSGGGFRATLFHLGVIEYLRDNNLLKHVKKITAVSGGAILAAHLSLNWKRYIGTKDEFVKVRGELINFVQAGIRENIVFRLPITYFFKLLRLIPIMQPIIIIGIIGVISWVIGKSVVWVGLGIILGCIIGKAINHIPNTSTNLLIKYYNNFLYKNKKISDLKNENDDRPEIRIAVTNLTSPNSLCYFDHKGFHLLENTSYGSKIENKIY